MTNLRTVFARIVGRTRTTVIRFIRTFFATDAAIFTGFVLKNKETKHDEPRTLNFLTTYNYRKNKK